MKKLLLIVDPQYSFINGSLAVESAEEKMNALSEYIMNNDYNNCVITCDWHPENHISFVENGGQWTKHCIQHTEGAAVYQPIIDALTEKSCSYTILEKGTISTKEEFSVLENYLSSKELIRLIAFNEIERIDICGICGDVCVLSTIKDLIKCNFKDKLNVLTDFCPSLDGGTILNNFIAENALKSM